MHADIDRNISTLHRRLLVRWALRVAVATAGPLSLAAGFGLVAWFAALWFGAATAHALALGGLIGVALLVLALTSRSRRKLLREPKPTRVDAAVFADLLGAGHGSVPIAVLRPDFAGPILALASRAAERAVATTSWISPLAAWRTLAVGSALCATVAVATNADALPDSPTDSASLARDRDLERAQARDREQAATASVAELRNALLAAAPADRQSLSAATARQAERHLATAQTALDAARRAEAAPADASARADLESSAKALADALNAASSQPELPTPELAAHVRSQALQLQVTAQARLSLARRAVLDPEAALRDAPSVAGRADRDAGELTPSGKSTPLSDVFVSASVAAPGEAPTGASGEASARYREAIEAARRR